MKNGKFKDALHRSVRVNISKGGAGFGLEQQDSGTHGGHAAAGNSVRLPAGNAASSTLHILLRDHSHINIHHQTPCCPPLAA